MPEASNVIIYFDIAAVVIMLVTLASFVLRGLTHGGANRVYISCMVLVTLTALAAVAGEVYDAFIGPVFVSGSGTGGLSGLLGGPSGAGAAATSAPPASPPAGSEYPLALRNGVTIVYYALRSLAAPAYLVLITVVSDTSHRLNRNNLVRALLWVPMVAVVLVVLTNPFHHLIFSYESGVAQRGPLIWLLYADAIYYSLIGIGWLIRWRVLFDRDEFATLILLYPIILATAAIQYEAPGLRLEMFVTSIAMMLISAFVIRPERRRDALFEAASLASYRDMCRRAFLTDKHLCLVFIEIINADRLRELVGKEGLQKIAEGVAKSLASRLSRDDELYYLRNGLFCISARNTDPERARRIAERAHEEGKAAALARRERSSAAELRSCVVRAPEDAPDVATLDAFVHRYAHLVPASTVTTFAELSKRSDFALQMALSGVIERAIKERSFEIYYQPIYRIADGRFHSAEALVRLNDPTFGWVPPGMFIPMVEQSGAIVDVDDILLDKICAFLGSVDYAATKLDYVEVNLSVEECVRYDLADELLALMRSRGVEPSRINLEVTETSAAFSQQIIERNVHRLAAAGVSFSLDDYGTGYSNITRALALPFTLVKIDKSFVDALDDPPTRAVLARTIAMMKEISLEVLVEGVETREQVDTLAAMGADYIQGYHFARPMPEPDFVQFLLEHNA